MNKVKRLARKYYYVKKFGANGAKLSDNRYFSGHRRLTKDDTENNVPTIAKIRQSRINTFLKKLANIIQPKTLASRKKI